MNAKHLHPSARKNTAAVGRDPGAAGPAASPAGIPGRACCCPAKAAVRVIMPPAQGRPGETDLLLCGHHYLVSRRALSAAGGEVRDLPGTPPDVAAWIHEAA
ncbi:MAG TPA: hypothetical protein VGF32_24070 [Streptosporangiaceae bacterium]|jgi:hypothetical protein